MVGNRLRNPSAFTLAELIVVITILAILATVGFLSLSGYSEDARMATLKANARTVYSAILTESTTSGNSPRWYVAHDPSAALSGAVVFVEGKTVALTGGDVGQLPTDSNYSAGNPRWDRLRMNGDKFKLSYASPLGSFDMVQNAAAAYSSTGSVTVGAIDAMGKPAANGRKRPVSYFQVAGIGTTTKATIVGNYSPTGSNSSVGLIRDPYSTGSANAVVEGTLGTASSDPLAPPNCAAIKSANPSAASGTYVVDPDGFGGYAPMKAYCDMTTAGGGWTVVASDGSASITQTINTMTGTPSPTTGGILPAFLEVPISRIGSEIRVVSLSDATRSATFSMTGAWLQDPALKDLEYGYLYDADNGFEGGAEGAHKCNFSIIVIDNIGGCTQSLSVSYPANGKLLNAIKGNDGSGYGAGVYSWQFWQNGSRYRLGWTAPSGFASYYNERMPSYMMVR